MRVFTIRKHDGEFVTMAVGTYHEVMQIAGDNHIFQRGGVKRNRSRVNHWYNV